MNNQQHFNDAAAAVTDTPSEQERLNKQLFDAAGNSETGQVKKLIAMGADVHYQDHQQFTPLHIAAAKNHADTVIALVEAGARINHAGVSDWTPLHRAVQWRAAEAASTLIILGADTSLKDNFDMTPFDVANHFHYEALAYAISVAKSKRREIVSLGNAGKIKTLHHRLHRSRTA